MTLAGMKDGHGTCHRKVLLGASLALGLSALSAAAQDETAGGSAIEQAISADIQAYCTNIADEARDRRYLLQKQNLETLRVEIDERIVQLEQRRAEYEDWLARRNEFLDKAKAGLVDIYKGMRPDAAAERLELVGPEIAAAIIMQLDARMAAEILNEMETQMAATLTSVIASAGDKTTSRNPS